MTDSGSSPEAVDQDLLERFEGSWSRGRPDPIEQFLPEPGDPRFLATLEALVRAEMTCGWRAWATSAAPGAETMAGPPPLEVYLERFSVLGQPEVVARLLEHECRLRRQHGQTITLDDCRRRFPDVVVAGSQVESMLGNATGGSLAFEMSGTAGFDESGTQRLSAAPRRQFAPGRFGNYELLAEIGRGGMGVVYRARQCTADRIVALKVIRRDRLDALPRDSRTSAMDRFRHEAHAAARLEHENIVTVYEVGEIDGEQFFSMRYVEGNSLSELLRGGPMEGRRAAGYLEPIARAVHDAHVHGILHRDLKPQNILVDRKTDRGLVADFGLAKLTEGAEELTRAGEVMGTPPYMSPEQAKDSTKVTALTDVYALGATLYHVVTGRPPFQAATPIETLRQVMDEEPVPLRQLNPSIDRDLETICLKCLQKEPPRRYDSALALADELRRYLNNEPILARPVGVWGRTVRWCRRNPVVAALLGTAALLAVAVVAAILVGYAQTSAALVVAEDRYRQVRQTVDKFCTRVSEDTLLNQPGMQPLRKELLEMALAPYEQLLDERADDPTIRDELARAHFRIGRINEAIDSPEKAMTSYERARKMQQELTAETPDDPGRLEALGNTWTAIGRTLYRQQTPDEAQAAHEEAADIRRRLVEHSPNEGEFKRMLANSMMNIGIIERETGHGPKARKLLDEAQTLRLEAVRHGFDSPRLQRDLGMGYYNLARLACARGEVAASERSFREAISIFEGLLKTDPRDLTNQSRLIVCYRVVADLICRQDWEAALGLYRKAMELTQRLAWANPDVPEYQFDLARLHMNLGQSHLRRKAPDAAIASYRQATQVLGALVDAYPEVADYRWNLARTVHQTAVVQMTAKEYDPARIGLKAAKEAMERLIERAPENADYTAELGRLENNLGKLHQARGDPRAAVESYQKALAVLEPLAETYPKTFFYRLQCVQALKAIAELRGEDKPAARDALLAARQHVEAARDRLPPEDARMRQALDAELKRIDTLLGGLDQGPE